MTPLQKTFLSMIRTSLWNEPFQCEDGVLPEELYREAERYEIAGITSDKREIFCSGDTLTQRKWFIKSMEDYKKSLRILEAQTNLNALLAERGITPIFIKGIASAYFYPNPLQRHIGDIDFFVTPQQYDDCCKAMEENGYEQEEDNLRHISYKKDGIEFECHRYFSQKLTRRDVHIDSILLAACESGAAHTVKEKSYRTLPNAEYGIMLLEHTSVHLKSGVGFRQYLDWVMYVNAVADDDFWEKQLRRKASECGFERLAKVLTRSAQLYLGLRTDGITWCSDVEESVCEELLGLLFSCDNFGFTEETNLAESTFNACARRGMLKAFNLKAMQNFPAASRIVILRPIAWLYQLIIWTFKGICAVVIRGERLGFSTQNVREQKKILKDIGV